MRNCHRHLRLRHAKPRRGTVHRRPRSSWPVRRHLPRSAGQERERTNAAPGQGRTTGQARAGRKTVLGHAVDSGEPPCFAEPVPRSFAQAVRRLAAARSASNWAWPVAARPWRFALAHVGPVRRKLRVEISGLAPVDFPNAPSSPVRPWPRGCFAPACFGSKVLRSVVPRLGFAGRRPGESVTAPRPRPGSVRSRG